MNQLRRNQGLVKRLLSRRWFLGLILIGLILLLALVKISAWRSAKKISPEILPKGSLIAEQYYQKALLAKAETNASEVKKNILPAYQSDPRNPVFLEVYGWAEFNLANYDQAGEIYQALVEVQPTASYYNYLGNALREAGRTQEAVQAFQTAIEKNYQFRTAYQNLVNLYQAQNWTNKKDLVAFLQKMASHTDNILAQEYLEEVLNI